MEGAKEAMMDNDKSVLECVLNFYKNNVNSKLGSMESDSLVSWVEKLKAKQCLKLKHLLFYT